jgi:hypothetical protein
VIYGQAQQLQGGRVGLQNLQARVDHQHAVGEVVDHQTVDLLLGLGAQAVEQGLGTLAPDTLGQLVREIGHAEIAGAGKSRLVVRLGAVVEPAMVLPEGVGQRQQRDAGRGAKGQHQSAQRRGDQDGNGQQRGVVERADLKDLQQKDRRNVDADHGQPLQGCARRWQMTSGSQAQHDGQRQIGEADQPGQGELMFCSCRFSVCSRTRASARSTRPLRKACHRRTNGALRLASARRLMASSSGMAVCCQGEAEFTMRSVALSVLLGQAAVFCAAEDLARGVAHGISLRQVKAAVSASYHGL